MKTSLTLLCLIYALLSQTAVWGQCSNTAGPNGGISSAVAGGGVGWNNITRIQAPDLSYTSSTAVFTIPGGNSTSQYLTLQNFGFAIPVSASICGIQVDIARFGSGLITLSGTIKDKSIKIIQGGVIGGSEMSAGADWSGVYGYSTFGGNGNLWGLGWTPADINSPGFGVAMSVSFNALLAVTLTANIDYVQMTVYYSNSTLAIPLQNFSATSDEGADLLSWAVPSSNDLSRFDVQRSDGSGNWQQIATVSAASAKMSYSYYDGAPLPGVNDYRLRLMGMSGSDVYSPVQEISRNDLALSIYPNPVASVLNISGHNVIHHVAITDLEGRLLSSLTTNGQVRRLQIPVAGLHPGMYLLNVDRSVIKWIKN